MSLLKKEAGSGLRYVRYAREAEGAVVRMFWSSPGELAVPLKLIAPAALLFEDWFCAARNHASS